MQLSVNYYSNHATGTVIIILWNEIHIRATVLLYNIYMYITM